MKTVRRDEDSVSNPRNRRLTGEIGTNTYLVPYVPKNMRSFDGASLRPVIAIVSMLESSLCSRIHRKPNACGDQSNRTKEEI